MRVLAILTEVDLAAIKHRGVAPQDAVQALLAEAKRRNPEADHVVLRKHASGGGFDIVAL